MFAPSVTQKQPFFRQLNRGIVVYVAGLVAAMLAAYTMFGGGMIARFMDVLRVEFTRMPDAALQPFADAVNSALSLGGAPGGVSVEVLVNGYVLGGGPVTFHDDTEAFVCTFIALQKLRHTDCWPMVP